MATVLEIFNRIDVSGVPSKLQGEALDQFRLKAAIQLMNPSELEFCAIHETGHELYYREAGIPIVGYIGPRIGYNDENGGSFVFFPAAVKPDYKKISPPLNMTAQRFHDLWLQGIAAGGVFAREILRVTDGRDEDDERAFAVAYNLITQKIENRPCTESEIKDAWIIGKEAVVRDLQTDPALEHRAREKAAEIKPKLFLWL